MRPFEELKMTRIPGVLAAIATLLVLPACKTTTVRVVSAPSAAEDIDSTAEVQGLLDSLMAANNAGDVEQAVAFYTENAVLLPPTEPEIAGRDAIRAHYVEAFKKFGLQVRATLLEARTTGRWGVVRGTVQGTLTGKPDGTPQELDDKFVGIVDRGSDGVWRFSRMIWSPVAKRP